MSGSTARRTCRSTWSPTQRRLDLPGLAGPAARGGEDPDRDDDLARAGDHRRGVRIRVLPLLGPGRGIRRFTCIDLSDSLELNDTVGPVYHKSAVYLVAKGFEEGLGGSVNEVPILGLAKYWDAPLAGGDGRTLEAMVAAAGGQLIEARSGAPVDARSDATTHSSLDNDPLTLTSVAMRAHGATSEPERFSYQANAAL
jgi:hypothetical protein